MLEKFELIQSNLDCKNVTNNESNKSIFITKHLNSEIANSKSYISTIEMWYFIKSPYKRIEIWYFIKQVL